MTSYYNVYIRTSKYEPELFSFRSKIDGSTETARSQGAAIIEKELQIRTYITQYNPVKGTTPPRYCFKLQPDKEQIKAILHNREIKEKYRNPKIYATICINTYY